MCSIHETRCRRSILGRFSQLQQTATYGLICSPVKVTIVIQPQFVDFRRQFNGNLDVVNKKADGFIQIAFAFEHPLTCLLLLSDTKCYLTTSAFLIRFSVARSKSRLSRSPCSAASCVCRIRSSFLPDGGMNLAERDINQPIIGRGDKTVSQ